jgi:hypothetical protein
MDVATNSVSASRAFSGAGANAGATVRNEGEAGMEATSRPPAPAEPHQHSPVLVLPTLQDTPAPAAQMIGTPWTVNNAALPAYPAQFTPQLPYTLAAPPGGCGRQTPSKGHAKGCCCHGSAVPGQLTPPTQLYACR